MKRLNDSLYVAVLLMMNQIVFATCADDNPQGPDAVISCAASLQPTPISAETFWNTILFTPVVIDGYCKKNPTDLTTAQRAVYDLSCSHQTGTYFSYAQFIAADAQMKTALGNNYNFMRGSSYALNTAELSNFLATAAQETTGNGLIPDKYTKDGLYFRTEYSYLGANTCYVYPDNPNWNGAGKTNGTGCDTMPLANYYTNYYPLSTYSVAIKDNDATLVYTPFVMDNDGQYNLNAQITVSFPGLPTLYRLGAYEPPSGTVWQYMNQTTDKGYWVGNGNLQLTGVAMTQFFGWYYQNLVDNAPVDFADFNNFVKTYLQDGKLAWLGGLWYWNVRIQGFNQPTLHAVLTGPKAACHDIGLTTYLINGGCNNDVERVRYYKYFKSIVFKQSSDGVPYPFPDSKTNSMQCSQGLKDYCTAP